MRQNKGDKEFEEKAADFCLRRLNFLLSTHPLNPQATAMSPPVEPEFQQVSRC